MPKYSNPDLKKSMLPTMEQLRKYLISATETDNLKTRDVRQLMSFLQRLPQVDRYLLGLMQTRKVSVIGFDHTIKYPDDMAASDTEQKQLQEMKNRFVKTRMYTLFNTIMNGILFGMSACRLTWKPKTIYGTAVIGKHNLDLTELDYNQEEPDKLNKITTEKSGFSREELDEEVHVFTRSNPLEGIIEDYPGGFMRTNMIYILLKYIDFFNWASANEKYADPLRFAQYRKGADDVEVSKVLAGLAQLGSDSYAAFSDDIEVKFVEALKSGITSMHKEFVEAVNKETSISILGQTLTTEITNIGSFAAAKVHNFVRQDILWSDIIIFQNVLSAQYLQKDYFLNYGEPKNAYPVFRFNTDEIDDVEVVARTYGEIKSSTPGFKVRKKELYDKLKFTMPTAEDNPEDLI